MYTHIWDYCLLVVSVAFGHCKSYIIDVIASHLFSSLPASKWTVAAIYPWWLMISLVDIYWFIFYLYIYMYMYMYMYWGWSSLTRNPFFTSNIVHDNISGFQPLFFGARSKRFWRLVISRRPGTVVFRFPESIEKSIFGSATFRHLFQNTRKRLQIFSGTWDFWAFLLKVMNIWADFMFFFLEIWRSRKQSPGVIRGEGHGRDPCKSRGLQGIDGMHRRGQLSIHTQYIYTYLHKHIYLHICLCWHHI